MFLNQRTNTELLLHHIKHVLQWMVDPPVVVVVEYDITNLLHKLGVEQSERVFWIAGPVCKCCLQ